MSMKAALYLRSSKDRSDVSIDAQRRQLQELAVERGYLIAAEFSDVVESGKDDQRPGFQALVAAVRDKQRGWDTVLILDTSRLARRRHIALIFEESECRKFGVKVVYKSLPDADPITEMLLKSILQAMDEWHSLTSKAKGLAGMAENVRQGWRAGGRAPMGYQLEHIETGAIRDGEPVVKSRLIRAPEASKVQVYLKAKLAGVSRKLALNEAGLAISESTAIGLEWNALTYAGHTVWNQHNEMGRDGYVGGVKRRPRSEWVIQNDTHEALISTEEAEALLSRLANSNHSKSRRTSANYLLSGILRSPDGTAWHSDGEGAYRAGKGQRIKADIIETAVLTQIAQDLQSTSFVEAFTAAAKAQIESKMRDTELPRLRKELASLDRQIGRVTGLLAQTSKPEALLRQIEIYEQKREELETEVAQRAALEKEAEAIRNLTEVQVGKVMKGLAEDMASLNRERLKDFVRGLVEKVELDAAASTLQLAYFYNAGNRVASPRGFEPRLPP